MNSLVASACRLNIIFDLETVLFGFTAIFLSGADSNGKRFREKECSK